MLISGLITSDSKIMFVRDVRTMAEKAAPFLSFDSQPYPVVVKGKVYWILAGYTTTSDYPYSENADKVDVPEGSGLPGSYNYVRNSVDVVVSAYTGSMNFYAMPGDDPILKAYEAAFPGIIKSKTQIPVGIRSHLRYGQDMFAAQAAVYGKYHITNPEAFYSASDAWLVTPTLGVSSPDTKVNVKYQVNSQGQVVGGTYEPMTPLYQVLAEPGQTVQSFTVTDAYVPAGKGSTQTPVLRAFLMGSSDPTSFGKLHVYETNPSKSKVAPIEADLLMSATPAVSRTLTYLDQKGSTVKLGSTSPRAGGEHGDLRTTPLRPGESGGRAQPELKRVIGVLGHKVVMEPTLNSMLNALLGTSLSTTSKATAPGAQTTPISTSSGTKTKPKTTSSAPSAADVQEAKTDLAKAAEDFAAAQVALEAGNLGTYQTDVKAAEALTTQAEKLLTAAGASSAGGSSPTTTTTTPATSPTTTTSAAAAGGET